MRVFEFEVYTPQVSDRLRGGTKKSALKGCLCPAFKGIYLFKVRRTNLRDSNDCEKGHL